MIKEFSVLEVAALVLEHLERHRLTLISEPSAMDGELEAALAPVRAEYAASKLPPKYLDALTRELKSALPARWRALAEPFTQAEAASFGLWRGGDLISRLCYVGGGLVVGSLILWAPFIPIWEKWFPFALAVGAWWLPDLQHRFHRRRYARALGELLVELATAQKSLERLLTVDDLFPSEGRHD